MAEQYLTVTIFEQRMTTLDAKLDAVILRGADKDVEMEGRIKALETNQKNAGTIVTWLSGVVASIVTAGILLGVKIFGGK